jgi:hypothetical protein
VLKLAAKSGVIALLLSLCLPGVAQAAQTPPQPLDTTPFVLNGLCAFPVQIQLSGKSATLDLPGDRFIITAPDAYATVTNTTTGHSVSLNITGTFFETIDVQGNLTIASHGRSLLFDPAIGLVLVVGNYSFTLDANGLTALSGVGRLTDVCGLIG